MTDKNEKVIILNNVKDFNAAHTFECGQCFRWDRAADNKFEGVVFGRVVEVEQMDDTIKIYNISIEEFKDFFEDYLDLKRDYGAIKCELSKDDVLKESIKHGWGIRILKQDMWEILLSYILSARNSIPMIKKTVKRISQRFGTKILYKNKEYYSFPTPIQLKDASISDFEQCGAAFRSKYIKSAVQMMLEGKIDFEKIKSLDTEKARMELQKIPGVGPKVADCILLFSAGKYDAFPTDVWIKRVMEYFYSDGELSLKEIDQMKRQLFGNLAGFAQEYLFYYARVLKIGK